MSYNIVIETSDVEWTACVEIVTLSLNSYTALGLINYFPCVPQMWMFIGPISPECCKDKLNSYL